MLAQTLCHFCHSCASPPAVETSRPRRVCLTQDAVCRGMFQKAGQVRAAVVLKTALEIASAMDFLHSQGIVHGVRC